MKRLAILALGLALAPLAGAQLYKYIDKDGKTVYTDQPPTADSKQIRVPTGSTPAAATAAPGKADAKKEDPKVAAKKAEEASKAAAAKAANCEQARQQLQMLNDGGRIYKYNAAGEREYMSDDEIEAGRTRAKREVDEACKPG